MQNIVEPYYDIQPYKDEDVPAALERLIQDQEFINAIVHYKYPVLSNFIGIVLKMLVKRHIRRRLWANIKTIDDFQLHVAEYMKFMLKHSCEGLTHSGLEKLDKNKSYLFISNHRDIAMDPALVNWCLHTSGFKTVHIAIGDNLLKKPCATELMKLNKSFIVKRSAKAPREMLAAFGQLSAYIKHILDQKDSIWIAQKEGRAKDGNDKTDPAILKMFYMEGRKRKQTFSDYIAELQIVPVAISYENDPLDLVKAKEIYQKEIDGSYIKSEFEDIENIIEGIVGNKRRIHVAFGDVIDNSFDTPQALAKEIDRQIYQNYHLFPVNYAAANVEHESLTENEKNLFQRKLVLLSDPIVKIITKMYAKPLINREKIQVQS